LNNLLFSVTCNDVITALTLRTDILTLSHEEIELACQEVQEAINHNLDIRPYIDMGLDVWEITRKL
jgi:hypothetical protein